MSNAQIIYTIIILVYLIFMLLIGYITSKKATDTKSFFTADKSLGLIVSLGAFASAFVSSSSIVGYVGWLYEIGWKGLWSNGGTLVSVIIGSLFLMGKIREFGEDTIPDLFSSRYYDKKMKIVPIIVILLMYVVFLTVETMGAGKVLSVLLGMNYNLAVIITMVVFVIYTMCGGMYAVAWTNLFQAVIGFGFVVASIFIALNKVGGFGQMNLKLAQIDPGLVAPASGSIKSAIIFIISNHLVWGAGNISQPTVLTRALSAKDIKTAKTSTAWSGVVFVVFYLALMVLAGVTKVLFPDLPDVDFAFPVLVQNVFNPVLGGILIASVLSLIMSTTSSILLVVGSTIGKDFYKDFINPNASEQETLKLSRIAIISVGILATIFALTKPTSILKLQVFNYSTIASAFFIPMMVGFYWKKATKEGALASMIGGTIVNFLWYWLKKPWGIHPIIPALLTGTMLIYVVSLNTPGPPDYIIEKYFREYRSVI